MINFIVGLFFIFINFQIKLDLVPGTIEILPSFIGYLFIFRGVLNLNKKDQCFEDIKALSLAMAFYSLATFVTNIMGLNTISSTTVASLANSIVFQKVLPLFIIYRIIWGIIAIAEKENIDIQLDGLKMIFIYTVLVSFLTFFLDDSVILWIINAVTLVLNMVLLYYLYAADQSLRKKY